MDKAQPNDELARTACRLAYSRPARHNPSTGANPRTKAYARVYGAIFGKTDTKRRAPNVWNVQGRSCDRSVASIVRHSGYDDGMPRTCAAIYAHLVKSARWKNLGKWSGKESDLKPGDILIRLKAWEGVSGNHVCMFVGSAIAEEVYETRLRGTDADKGKPTGAWVSGHLAGGNPPDKGYAPCIGNAEYAGARTSARVFRCVKPQKSTKYTNL